MKRLSLLIIAAVILAESAARVATFYFQKTGFSQKLQPGAKIHLDRIS